MKRTVVAWMLVASCIIVPNYSIKVEPRKERKEPNISENISLEKMFGYNSNILYINNINKITKTTNIKHSNNKVNNRASRATSARTLVLRAKIYAEAIGHVESHGNYKAKSKWSSACGKYQYIRSTWNNYGGYSTACHAPKKVQDKRIMHELLVNYKKFDGDWEKVIAAHFYPKWAGNKAKWHRNVRGNNLTLREYVNKVKKAMN